MSKTRNLNNEQELVTACIDGDRQAQKILFELYAGKMLGVCARYCSNIDDAKDALHEGYIKVYNQISRFNGKSKLETWITRIMINTAIDQFKKSIKYQQLNTDNLKDEEYYIEYNEEQPIQANKLFEIINQLPRGYKVVFNLYAIEGFTHKEIANQLGISQGTSKSQLARARKMLQELLKNKGIIE